MKNQGTVTRILAKRTSRGLQAQRPRHVALIAMLVIGLFSFSPRSAFPAPPIVSPNGADTFTLSSSCQICGLSFMGGCVDAFSPSWRSEMQLSVAGPTGAVVFQPFTGQPLAGPGCIGGPISAFFPAVGPGNVTFNVTSMESFDDPGIHPDGVWNSYDFQPIECGECGGTGDDPPVGGLPSPGGTTNFSIVSFCPVCGFNLTNACVNAISPSWRSEMRLTVTGPSGSITFQPFAGQNLPGSGCVAGPVTGSFPPIGPGNFNFTVTASESFDDPEVDPDGFWTSYDLEHIQCNCEEPTPVPTPVPELEHYGVAAFLLLAFMIMWRVRRGLDIGR